MMRTTIKHHNHEYLLILTKQWGFSTTTDTINHLLFLLRTSNQIPQTQFPQTKIVNLESNSSEPQHVPHTIQDFGFSPLPYDTALAQQVDPIIERLVSLGICNEF